MGGTVESAQSDQRIIERIMYLSSLASVRADVDKMLDTLRLVTARAVPNQPLNADDRSKLLVLEENLKGYLVSKDPIRAFDRRSLENRLNQQEHHRTKPSVLLVVTITALTAALVPLLVPPYTGTADRLALVSVPLFFLSLSIGTAWLYLSALADFKPELRRAFKYICAGTLVLGFYFSQHAMVQAFHLYTHPLFQYAGFTWLITLAFFLIYLGIRFYARLLQAASIFISLPLMLSSFGISFLVALVVPHTSRVTHEVFFRFSFSGIVTLLVVATFGAGVARAILRTVTKTYGKSVRWLYVYLCMTSVACVPAGIASAAVGKLYGSTLALIIVLCGIAPIFIILYSGYSFKKETSQ